MGGSKRPKEQAEELAALQLRVRELEAAASDCSQFGVATQESERRLATLLENLPGMAYRCQNDERWTMEFVSGGCVPLTGYSCEDVLGNRVVSWNDLIVPEDRATVRAGVNRGLAEHRQFKITYRIRCAVGRVKWVWEQGIGIFDEFGECVAIEGFITDITERVQAEEAVRQARDELDQRIQDRTSELASANEQLRREIAERQRAEESLRSTNEELQAIYDGMVDGVLIADVETKRFLRANPAILRLTGYSEKEVLAMSVYDIHPAEDHPRVFKRFGEQAEGKLRLAEDRRVIRKDGSIVHVDISASRIVYHGRPCLIGFFRDITERMEAQEALQRSEAAYRSLVEASPDAVVLSDLAGHVVFASPQTWPLLGLPENEPLTGRSIFEFVAEEDRPRLAANLTNVIRAGVRHNTEYTALRGDGSAVPVEASSAVLRDAQGMPKGAMAIIRDIRARKLAEQALERERQTLWHMLQASDHERQVIAYEIHDALAQQLAGAIMQFQAFEPLWETSPEKAKAAYQAGVDMVRQAHVEARRLISGVRPPILDESGLAAAVAHLVHDQRAIGGPDIEFETRVSFDRLPRVLENAIYRIAQEALTNACRHSRSEKVRVTLLQVDVQVELDVQDWGVGFDPQAIEGERFGLEGIRERARLLGGTASIDSQPGRGTLVRVVLPLLSS